jgi:hypothetical protein
VLPKAAAEVRVAIQSCEIEWTFAAELTTEARLSRLAHIASTASTHCTITNMAAEAISMFVLSIILSLICVDEVAVVATMEAKAATVIVVCC